MRIVRAEVFRAEVELREPFRISLGVSYRAEECILRLETADGLVGFGEASPSKAILGDDIPAVIESLRRALPKILEGDPERPESLRPIIMDPSLSPSAAAAIDIALHDLLARGLGVPLYKLLGGAKDRIETDYTIGIKDPEEVAADAEKLVKAGFRVLKIKLGEHPERDIERIRRVRERVGYKVRIRVDANQGWSFEDAVRVIRELEKLEVELVEQPLKASDLEGHAKLRKLVRVPIMLDESVHTARDAIRAIRLEAADIINIKLMKARGIAEAVRIAHVAEAADVGLMVGCMDELEIGILAGIHFACGLGAITRADLDADLMTVRKLVKVRSIEIPYRIPPSKPGLGFDDDEVDRSLLTKVLEVSRH